jgi:photosystem II stability/assembly factor-like uncharacterized protein
MKNLSLLIITAFILQQSIIAQQGWWARNNGLLGTEFVGWTKVNGDTSTFYWNTKPVERYIGDFSVIQEEVYTIDDYRITIDTTPSGGLYARWYDLFTGVSYDTTFHLPLKVEIITDPNNPIDVSDNTWLMEFAVTAPWEEYRKYYYSQLGWDLVPGGLAYTKGSPGFYEKYIDILNFEKYEIDPGTGDTTYTGLLLQTNHQPDTYVNAYGDTMHINAVAPSHGDEFTVRTIKPQNLNSVIFIDNEVGWAAGGYTIEDSSNGFMVRTSDEGRNWVEQAVPPYEITSVCFLNPYLGWASTKKSGVLMGNCLILKTTNGGEDWVINRELINQELYDIFFIDNNFGWTVGSSGLINKTIDGGNNWISVQSGTNVILRSVHFNDYSTGWVVGDSGVILNTINGGVNWLPQTSKTTRNLYSVHFTDQNTGWVVGEVGTILMTTDGGTTWTSPTSGTTEDLRSVHFIDNNNGWAVGDEGTILKLSDGTFQTSGTTEDLRSVYFTDNITGYVVGGSGTILKTTTGGVTFVEEKEIDEIPTDYYLSQNYPNPFNPSTTIKFSISSSGYATLKIYNALGEEVAVLLNKELTTGSYEVEFNAYDLTSGIYFYRLQAGSFVETKKMILLK